MNDYKITLELEVRMDDAEAADDLGEALCNIVDTILDYHPTVRRYDGIIKYDLSEAGKDASFTTSLSTSRGTRRRSASARATRWS